MVVFAARMIPEKRAPLGVEGVLAACTGIPELRAVFFGDGPERAAVLAAIERAGADERITAPGFVDSSRIEDALGQALCMLLPSRREGYGLIVVEAASRGTPTVVVAGEDNAATELVQEGINGFIAPRADAGAIAAAIARVSEAGMSLRESTARWFNANAERLSLEHSLAQVLAAYGAAASARS
jgi:glycosyltransferase involved in cell wall biosynthesis